jgi:hypothetical protein
VEDVTYLTTACSRDYRFDAFLFASIGEQENGMPVSVLSALARLDIDPWREAESLARMPAKSADLRLKSLIEKLPDTPAKRDDEGTIASRLIALLPHRAPPPTKLELNWPEATAALRSQSFIFTVLFSVFFLASLLAAQWTAATPSPSAEKIDRVRAPTTEGNH